MQTNNLIALPTLFQPATPAGITDLNKNQKSRVAQLAIKVLEETDKALEQPNPNLEGFDAQVGDFGCELRAFAVYILASNSAIVEEVKQLRRNPQNSNLNPLVAYLLRARLLRLTRTTTKDEKENYITNSSLICDLVKKVPYPSEIVGRVQALFSEQSIDFVREQADKIEILASAEKCLLLRMLSLSKTNAVKFPEKYFPKKFSCTFYNFKAILCRLRELGAPLLLRKMVLQNQPSLTQNQPSYGVLFRLSREEGSFVSVPLPSQDPARPVIVIEAKISQNLPAYALKEKLKGINPYQLLLACAAQEPPFACDYPNDSLETVEDPAAKEELAHYRGLASLLECKVKANPIFEIDHFYCSTLNEERKFCYEEGSIQ